MAHLQPAMFAARTFGLHRRIRQLGLVRQAPVSNAGTCSILVVRPVGAGPYLLTQQNRQTMGLIPQYGKEPHSEIRDSPICDCFAGKERQIKVPPSSENLYFWLPFHWNTSKNFNSIVSVVIPQQSNLGDKSLRFANLAICCAAMACALGSVGCGTTTKRSGTEQLLISEAVDNAVAKLEFHELRGHKVFFDTTFLKSVRSDNFVNQDYVVSAIRQQLTAAGALIQDSRDKATTIVEARVGALGTDGHEITYGIPKTGGISAAASALSNSPVTALPEISLAQTNSQAGVAKVIVFAYDQDTKEPIWQSGVARAESSCSHTWVLGAGPFEKGSIYEGSRFAGKEIAGNNILLGSSSRENKAEAANESSSQLSFRDAHSFPRSPETDSSSAVVLASAEEDTTDDQDSSK